ncbi:MAG: hypothetical protein ACRCYZ_03100 [Alphaproteobacteria bacterium]
MMKNKLKISFFFSFLAASLGHSVNLEIDLMPGKTQKITKNGWFEVSGIENPYNYSEERLPKSYNAEAHSLILKNITRAYLEKKSEKIQLKKENGNLNFVFEISTTPFTTGKSEEENHYKYRVEASVPDAKVDSDETIRLKPRKIQFLGASYRIGPMDDRTWVDIKFD